MLEIKTTTHLFSSTVVSNSWHLSGMVLLVLILTLSFGENNAKFIKFDIPKTVFKDQTFIAKITMQNTGTRAWGAGSDQTGVTLVSQKPTFNMTWGTYFIILGQGNVVAPGDTFTFESPLRAPSDTGLQTFAWQCQNWLGGGGSFDTTTPFFGEIASTSIIVKDRELSPLKFIPKYNDTLIDSSDLEYVGSVKIPTLPDYDNTYTESGLTIKISNGSKNFLVKTGLYDRYKVYEISVPQFIPMNDENGSNIKTATIVKDWGDINYGKVGDEVISMNCGFYYDDSSRLLYWSHYNSYYAGNSSGFPQLMATRLNSDSGTTNIGAWTIPTNIPYYKGYWYGVTKLPERFSKTYTNDKCQIALGFGGYFSVCGGKASRGPALGAITKPLTESSTVNITPMLSYNEATPCVRDGNYLPVVGFWNDYPDDLTIGKWAYNDYCRAGVFVDLPDRKGYIAFVNQSIGRIGYDYGGYNTDEHKQDCWYFYDPKDLGAAYQGKISSNITPLSFCKVNYPYKTSMTGMVTGACFDSASRMIYVYVTQGLRNQKPVIHAYRISSKPKANIISKKTFNGAINLYIKGENDKIIVNLGKDNKNDIQKIQIFLLNGSLVYSKKLNSLTSDYKYEIPIQAHSTYVINLLSRNRNINRIVSLD